ncbi:DUF4265 domain-containing protein [Streptomyces sp. NPDC001288]|uniref:DUF4265 domain-containing protein n=1 Tax=Streptomyces sp. NPDC001297 TaxID=3364559 RepID=UPI0036CE8977
MGAQGDEAPVTEGRKLFKVAFDLPEEASDWPPVSVERLWGEKTDVRFEIRVVNTPFFVRGIAYGDLIRVVPDHDRRELVFDSFTAESGHSTIRVVVMDAGARGDIEAVILAAGCSWELGQSDSLLAVDIPLAVDYKILRQRLLEMKEAGRLGLQESAISTVHRGQLPSFP